MKCSLCGFEFKINEKVACKGCPLAATCGLIRCPNCGYEMPREANLVRLFNKWRQKHSED